MSSSSSHFARVDTDGSFWDENRGVIGCHVGSPTAGEVHEDAKVPNCSSLLAGGVAIWSGVTGDPWPSESVNEP